MSCQCTDGRPKTAAAVPNRLAEAEILIGCLNNRMIVIGNLDVGMQNNAEPLDRGLKQLQKMFVIASITKQRAALNPARRCVIPPVRHINSQWSCHDDNLSYRKYFVNVKC